MIDQENFNPVEAFLLGLEIEKAGADLYRRAEEKAPTTELRNVFADLARFEEDHIALFQDLLKEHEGNPEYLRPYDQDEAVEYIAHLLNADIFQRLRGALPSGVKEVLSLAIEAEKNSILLYTELKNLSKDPATADVFNRLLREEKEHFTRLSQLLSGQKEP